MSTLARQRIEGRGTPFFKDKKNGAVFYLAADVLAELLGPTHRSTNEYDTSDQLQKLEKARAAKSAKSSKPHTARTPVGPRG